MNASASILRFLLVLLATYALMMALWISIAGVYRDGFSLAANAMFGWFGSDGSVRFSPMEAAGAMDMDVEATLVNHRTGARGRMPVSSRLLAYVPMSIALALTLATPIGMRQRLRKAVWAMIWVHAYIALRVWIMLLAAFADQPPLATISLGPPALAALRFASDLLATSLTGCYLGPLFIWIAVTFRGRALAEISDRLWPRTRHSAPASR